MLAIDSFGGKWVFCPPPPPSSGLGPVEEISRSHPSLWRVSTLVPQPPPVLYPLAASELFYAAARIAAVLEIFSVFFIGVCFFVSVGVMDYNRVTLRQTDDVLEHSERASENWSAMYDTNTLALSS